MAFVPIWLAVMQCSVQYCDITHGDRVLFRNCRCATAHIAVHGSYDKKARGGIIQALANISIAMIGTNWLASDGDTLNLPSYYCKPLIFMEPGTLTSDLEHRARIRSQSTTIRPPPYERHVSNARE